MNIEEEMLMSIYVKELLSPLTPEQRRAMILHCEGLRYQEVAAEMGVPFWRVKKLLAQGLSKIRNFFGIRVPKQLEDGAWWPLVLESLLRHAKASDFT
jgi:DNA-directed RNA polymerase specialized sigma24 family protein